MHIGLTTQYLYTDCSIMRSYDVSTKNDKNVGKELIEFKKYK